MEKLSYGRAIQSKNLKKCLEALSDPELMKAVNCPPPQFGAVSDLPCAKAGIALAATIAVITAITASNEMMRFIDTTLLFRQPPLGCNEV